MSLQVALVQCQPMAFDTNDDRFDKRNFGAHDDSLSSDYQNTIRANSATSGNSLFYNASLALNNSNRFYFWMKAASISILPRISLEIKTFQNSLEKVCFAFSQRVTTIQTRLETNSFGALLLACYETKPNKNCIEFQNFIDCGFGFCSIQTSL